MHVNMRTSPGTYILSENQQVFIEGAAASIIDLIAKTIYGCKELAAEAMLTCNHPITSDFHCISAATTF